MAGDSRPCRGRRIGAEREKRSLREIDLAAQSENDRQAEDRDRVSRRLHQNVGDVAVGLDRRGERHQETAARRRRAKLSDRASGFMRHAFSATRSPKMPCGRTMRKRISTRKAKRP